MTAQQGLVSSAGVQKSPRRSIHGVYAQLIIQVRKEGAVGWANLSIVAARNAVTIAAST